MRQIATTLDDYVYTPDDQVVEGMAEEGRRYVEADFNRVIEIQERERHRVAIFMEMVDQSQKTVVFCATQDHAAAVRDLINQMKTSADPNYCVRVTAADGAIGEQWLRAFQDNEKTIPTVLTTSQKLSTGVDARNVRNIVLMRPVNSMIEFKQIVGRGTRLYDGKDCPPSRGKSEPEREKRWRWRAMMRSCESSWRSSLVSMSNAASRSLGLISWLGFWN